MSFTNMVTPAEFSSSSSKQHKPMGFAQQCDDQPPPLLRTLQPGDDANEWIILHGAMEVTEVRDLGSA